MNKIFDIETSSDYTEKEEHNFNSEKNEENILRNTFQTTHKRTIEKSLDESPLKPIKSVKKSKINETKELDNIFSSVSQRIINVLEDQHESNEDEAFAHFITVHLANLPQPEKNIRKKMITDALFSPLQKM